MEGEAGIAKSCRKFLFCNEYRAPRQKKRIVHRILKILLPLFPDSAGLGAVVDHQQAAGKFCAPDVFLKG